MTGDEFLLSDKIKGAEQVSFNSMAQANAGQGDAQQPGFVPNDGPQAAAAAAAAGLHGAIAVAGPIIPNPAGALPPPNPRFDIDTGLLTSPLPTKNNIGCYIHAKIT